MKSFLTVFCLAVALAIGGPASVQAATITDDFSDLNDTANPAWTHLNGLVNSTGQVWDASGANYKLTAPNNGTSTFGFIGSHVAPVYTDVNVMADLVDFVGPPAGGVFGVAARLNGNNAFAQLTGYAYAYEPFAAGGTGEVVLYAINPGLNITDIGSQQVTLNPAKDYTFNLSVIGTQLHGWVNEIGGGVVAEKYATHAAYASGRSGLIAYSQNPLPTTNVTWDNFKTQDVPEPATGLLVVLGGGAMLLCRRFRGNR